MGPDDPCTCTYGCACCPDVALTQRATRATYASAAYPACPNAARPGHTANSTYLARAVDNATGLDLLVPSPACSAPQPCPPGTPACDGCRARTARMVQRLMLTQGANLTPMGRRADRAAFCLAALLRGLRVERVASWPHPALIMISGSLNEVQRLCVEELKATLVERRGDATPMWVDVYVGATYVTGIVPRGELWAIQV